MRAVSQMAMRRNGRAAMLARMPLPGGRRGVRTSAVLFAVLAAALGAAASSGGAPVPVKPGAIAYVTDSTQQPEPEVWAALSTGAQARLLGPGIEPQIAPDGTLVAAGLFGGEHGPSLAVYTVGATAPLRLGELSKQDAMPLAWSPDSRYLAVSLTSPGIRNVAAHSGLGVLDMTTGKLRQIATGIVSGASFAPDGSDRIVFALAGSQSLSAKVNLYVAQPSGAGRRQITRDGRSLNPVWGARWIAYDRERLRRGDAPVYQIWLRRPSAGAARQLTSIRVRSLVSGLMPLGFSNDGSRLLAEFVGQDTSEAWTVTIASRRARSVRVKGGPVVGAAISGDGSRLLVAEGGLEGPAQGNNIVTVPFSGGAPTLLVAHAAQPSWNE